MADSLFYTIVSGGRPTITKDTPEIQGIKKIGKYALYGYDAYWTEISFPNTLQTIEEYGVGNCPVMKYLTIPASVTTIKANAFSEIGKNYSAVDNPDVNITFEHPASAESPLPSSAGSGSGAFYSKTSRKINIRTDNEAIKNYPWSSDGVTATFYHLDGTLWE